MDPRIKPGDFVTVKSPSSNRHGQLGWYVKRKGRATVAYPGNDRRHFAFKNVKKYEGEPPADLLGCHEYQAFIKGDASGKPEIPPSNIELAEAVIEIIETQDRHDGALKTTMKKTLLLDKKTVEMVERQWRWSKDRIFLRGLSRLR